MFGQIQPVRWNHNIHYHSLVLRAVPNGARSALDVGTGDGLLARELRRVVPRVVGLDVDEAVLTRAGGDDVGVEWMLGDVRTAPLPAASFDVVASIATLHHLPNLDCALRRFADLTAPGGVVVVVGLAEEGSLIDCLWGLGGALSNRVLSRRRVFWEHSAPTVWPPPHTYAEVHRAVSRALPGARWRRLALWRYAVVWTKPGGD